MQDRRRYVNFENGSHFICSFNLNNPETTVCIAFRINGIASGAFIFLNGIIGNSQQSRFINFNGLQWFIRDSG